MAIVIDELRLVPLYTQSEAALLLGMPQSTFNSWASGYVSGSGARQPSFITVSRAGRGYTVPFIGLAEAWIVRAFTRAGVPVRRIRPALDELRQKIGIEHALASERLTTDGLEILWDLQERNAEFADNRLVVVRNGDVVFGEVVREHLKLVDYRAGFISRLRIPIGAGADVTLDPEVNYGQPTLSDYGVRVEDIRHRISAGETFVEVAADYDVPPDVVSRLALAAV